MNIIWTNFYISQLDTSVECKPIITKNYTEYTLFAFENWLYPRLTDELGDYVLDYVSLVKGGEKKEYLTLKFLSDGQELKLSPELTEKIQELISAFGVSDQDFVYIFYFNPEIYTDDGCKLPKIWINQMIAYLNLDPGYQVHLGEFGALANVRDYPDYIDVYTELQLQIKYKLIDSFKEGYIVNPPEDVVKRWELISVNDRLYKIPPTDSRLFLRYKYRTNFLLERVSGNTSVLLKFPNDFLYRHLFAESAYSAGLNNFTFTDDGINLIVDNLQDTLKALKIMDEIKLNEKPNTKMEFLYLVNPSEINIDSGIIYRVNDRERPFVYSKIL